MADLLTLYGVSDPSERDALLAMVKQANTPGWLRTYSDVLPNGVETRLDLEQAAVVIRSYEVQYVPGLLQTNDYACASIRLDHPDALTHEVERRVSLLMRRQQILYRPQPTKVWAILDEAALRRQLGRPATMRHQLEHLIEITALPHVTIQVMPFSTGVAAGGPITLLRFAERELLRFAERELTDVVALEQPTSMLYPDKPDDIQHYKQVLDTLSIRSEPPTATAAILRRILNEV